MVETVRYCNDVKRIRERERIHKKAVNGYFSYKRAILLGLIAEDKAIPKNVEDLRVVKNFGEDKKHISREHIINLPLYNKLVAMHEKYG